MTHRLHALNLLASVEEGGAGMSHEQRMEYLAAAQVHALLALELDITVDATGYAPTYVDSNGVIY